MAVAIEMFLDEHADAAVRQLWRQLAESGLPSLESYGHARHRPHVSLTITSDRDLDPAVQADIGRAVSAQPRLGLSFEALGIFTGSRGVLFLAATPTTPLLALHERVSESLRRHGVAPWPHYLPGTWLPHCTLAMDLSPAELATAIERLCRVEPFQARVVETGITDTSTGATTAVN